MRERFCYDAGGELLIVPQLGRLPPASGLGGGLFSAPLDLPAWQGNHAPRKYGLGCFNALGSISYDDPDPPIFLVLRPVSDSPGVDNIDRVIFPPRWPAAHDTFRPLVPSQYRQRVQGADRRSLRRKASGFEPGGASLHNCMTGRGPDAEAFECASRADIRLPQHSTDNTAFMFETRALIRPAPHTRAAGRGSPGASRRRDHGQAYELAARACP